MVQELRGRSVKSRPRGSVRLEYVEKHQGAFLILEIPYLSFRKVGILT